MHNLNFAERILERACQLWQHGGSLEGCCLIADFIGVIQRKLAASSLLVAGSVPSSPSSVSAEWFFTRAGRTH